MRIVCAFGLVGLMIAATLASGQDQQQKDKVQGKFGAFGGAGKLPADLADKLGLNADQKDKLAKFTQEYESKTKEAQAKMQKAMEDAKANKDFAAIRTVGQEVREVNTKAREAFDTQLAQVLNEDQKKKFEEIKKAQPAAGRGFGGFGGGGSAGQVLSQGVQDRLELTQEQKDKVASLQKEIDGKLGQILTPDQKKKLDDLKSGQAPRRPNQP